ncbi:MAG: hypothetical protein COV07_02265 [Candidatus Vogelbacteria bacterium CG10_big_fil_rev_8_21_14_0_10_45_14]|uniref:Uncharacterized protein n=1 Tax=Candidatus Vogelbacteria bacterium CG10_big_fil_rev_8_21_14_0_10_45_14 TaxID=1975042 RepID=A0A2H0RJP2_9BACT|nr:MAG: hypothetical protein COV07_02265 [Candidatus Vogelbacteria bacterium CG10_big_fil_rev_8_21_14_0_10_45_14]
MKKILKKILERKVLSGSIALLLVIGGYLGYGAIFSKDAVAQYALAQVQKGTLVVSIAGSGQVSVSNQVDLKPKVSGDIVYVGIKNGQEVKAGALIARLDAGDAQKAVRDAEVNLESAKLALEKLKQPATSLSVLQAENAVTTAERNLGRAQEDYKQIQIDAEQTLNKTYEDAYSAVSDAFLKFPNHINNLQDVLGTEQSTYEHIGSYKIILGDDSVFVSSLLKDYEEAIDLYNDNFMFFRTVLRNDDRDVIYQLLSDTLTTAKAISQTLESARNMYDEIVTKSYKKYYIVSTVDTMRPLMQVAIAEVNPIISSLQNNKDTINDVVYQIPIDLKNSQLDIEAATETLAEKTDSLAKVKAGTDSLDIQSSELTVRQRENALRDAKEKLADYFVRAPFAGIIANLDVEKGEGVSSATVIGTLVTKQKIAEVSMNEIDVAKVKVGQKSTLTFDAIPDLIVNGQVAEMDTIGTVSQGVVTYNIKIGLDAQDERVKPGMSASAEIVTDTKPDVLLVPNSAVKSPNDNHYVEIVDAIDPQIALTANVSAAALQSPPRRQQVEVGISNDEVIEIIGGLKEGDIVVIRTVQGGQNSPAQTSRRPSLFGGRR